MKRKTSILIRIVGLAVMIALVAGCEVGPDYHRPALEPVARFKSLQANEATSIPAQWWKLYRDPILDRLIATANASNQNIRQAIARVDAARAMARIAASYLLPTVTFDPSYTRTRTSGTRVNPNTGTVTPTFVYNDYLAPIDLRYEIDVWGRLRRQYEQAAAQATATRDDAAFVRLTVQTDVGLYYFALRSLDAQDDILQQNVNAYREQVRLVTVSFKNGLTTQVDLYQAQAQLEATLAQQKDVERARSDEEHALATLCGRPAPKFSMLPDPLAGIPPQVPPGLPAQILDRRPDVAEAEQNIVAANAQIGVATADFYPTFTLTGAAGFESASAASFFDWKSKMAEIGPGFSLPLFEGGRLKANLELARAQYRQALANYVNQVLTAYGDVEDALTDLHALSDEVKMLREAVVASRGYLRISGVQYRRGLVNYLIVIDSERTLLSNELSLAQALDQQMAASIHLIKALGGGWEMRAKSEK